VKLFGTCTNKIEDALNTGRPDSNLSSPFGYKVFQRMINIEFKDHNYMHNIVEISAQNIERLQNLRAWICLYSKKSNSTNGFE